MILSGYYSQILAAGGEVTERKEFPPLMPRDEFIKRQTGQSTPATETDAAKTPPPPTGGPTPLPVLEKKPGQTAPTAGTKTYTEAEVRARAQSEGIDPEKLLANVRNAGLLR